MNCSDCSARLADYACRDPALSAAEIRALDQHLDGCARCRAELAAFEQLRAATAALPRDVPPARDLWPAIAARLDAPPPRRRLLAFPSPLRLLPLATAAIIVFLSAFVARHAPPHSSASAWSVAAVAGAPRVAARPVHRETPFRLGQWLETDATSRARVAVGGIGEVRVEPNSRLRLLGATATDQRIELARGTVDAFIWAPPRIFFVDTPSATAVDLGCAYTLTVDDRGDAVLHVTAGYVALEHGERESIVPAGLTCLTRRDAGPGTPFDRGAPAPLRAALEAFDFGPADARPDALPRILEHARAGDAVTLWHLLARTHDAARAAVFDTLARLAPPPPGITRAGILAGDTAMRRLWADALGLGPFVP